MSDRPLQAFEVKIHNCLLSLPGSGWFIHCTHWWSHVIWRYLHHKRTHLCFPMLLFFFNLQFFYIQNLAGGVSLCSESATCHGVTRHLSRLGFVCKHCDIQPAHFATSYPGCCLLTQSASLVFEENSVSWQDVKSVAVSANIQMIQGKKKKTSWQNHLKLQHFCRPSFLTLHVHEMWYAVWPDTLLSGPRIWTIGSHANCALRFSRNSVTFLEIYHISCRESDENINPMLMPVC